MRLRLTWTGGAALVGALTEKQRARFDKVAAASLTSMYNRAAITGASGGGTPVDNGELRKFRTVEIGAITKSEGEFGYVKEYAPHVEYGHLTTIGGYVEGQRFLQQNVEIETPLYYAALMGCLKEE